MKSFNQVWVEDRRLAILRVLDDRPGKNANSSILHTSLVMVLRITCERHEVIDDLRTLQLHQLVELEQIEGVPHLYGVELTGRGEDVAHGRLVVDGVSRPRRGGT